MHTWPLACGGPSIKLTGLKDEQGVGDAVLSRSQ